uniref:gonadotropin-releasing hormone receptor-like isoform X2 n=1 Tax=Styela clava TaxID=7725 RepID=UPI00193A076E|nr:gonadotropin-releasing hormone receptor-like isoform X2 [Styela clava]
MATDNTKNFTYDRGGPYFNASWEYYKNLPFAANFSDGNISMMMEGNCKAVMSVLYFDKTQLARVIVTWIMFLISAVGNSFVLFCVCRKSRTSHVHLIMLHFAVADLAFTFLVMPKDAMWNSTMQWLGGDVLCRICQMSAQMGMYISSFMVVVTALDRCCSILLPMANSATKQRRRTKYLVGGAWILSILSAIPTAIIFGVKSVPYCPDMPPLSQCVDYVLVNRTSLRPYYFFTMAMSFLFPMTFSLLFYSLVICEISNMMRRDRERLGRRDSTVSIMRARKKTLKITGMVMFSFLLFWGPYYGFGIYDWFNPDKKPPKQIATILFLLMYFHPAIHPFIYGFLMKDVRDRFKTTMLHLEKIFTCSAADVNYSDNHVGCFSSPEKERYSQTNGYALAKNMREPVKRNSNAQKPVNGERDRLISANSSDDNKQCGDRSTPDSSQNPDRVVENPENNGIVPRASTVSFRLPGSVKVTAEPATGNALNNNNKEMTNSSDDIIKSTNV